MPSKPVKKVYETILIGTQSVKGKDNKITTKKIYSSIDRKKAEYLGLKGFPDGAKVIRRINKGVAKGAQYTTYVVGVKGKGYGLVFLEAGNTSNAQTKGRNINTKTVRIPVPVGTPLAIIAKFAQTLKKKPIAILTRKNTRYYLNNSQNSQGGK